VDVSPDGDGSVKVEQSVPSYYPASYTFSNGTEVRLEAIPADGYLFNNWGGHLSGTTNPTTILINCDKSIRASFSQIMHSLTMQVTGSGATSPPVGVRDYAQGTRVSITATPDSGWQFDSWTGDVAEPGSATTTLTIDSDKMVAANFSQIMTNQGGWPLVGKVIAGLALVGWAVIFLIIRRRTP